MADSVLLRIPPGPDSGCGRLSDYAAVRRTCVFVGKGPSAVAVPAGPAHVATVNEACRLVPGGVDWAFFTDACTLEAVRPDWGRIRHFVVPPVVHGDGPRGGVVPITSIPGLPLSRVLVVAQDQLPQRADEVLAAAEAGAICYSDTATLGAHALALLGYRHLRLYGHDGGRGYAPGVPCLDPEKDHTPKRLLLEVVLGFLHRRFGLTWEFNP